MTEIWDIVNKDGEKIGVTCERTNHDKIPEGMYHPCVEVWVRVGERLLLTRRHPDKNEPLAYEVPGGAVVSGEDMLGGAMRELAEEAGVVADISNFRELGRMTNGKVYAVSYLLLLNEMPQIKLQESEVVGYKMVTQSELEEMLGDLTRGARMRYNIYKEEIFDAKTVL